MKVQKNIKLYFLSLNKDSTYSLKKLKCLYNLKSLQIRRNMAWE